MISINLVSKKKRVTKKKGRATITFLIAFGIFTLYFLFEVVSVSIGLIASNQQLARIKSESEQLSSQILKDNLKLNKYILSKYILTQIRNERAKKFDYLGLLDNVINYIPDGSSLNSVSFGVKNFVSVGILSDTDLDFKVFEDKIRQSSLNLAAESRFSSIIFDALNRNTLGDYSTNMLFGIAKK